jgi:hypothetical protein
LPVIPFAGCSVVSTERAQVTPESHDSPDGIGAALGRLFPAAPAARPLAWGWRVLVAAAEVAAVGLGAAVLLLRVPGIPPWRTVYEEDYFVYLPWAILHPGFVFAEVGGYEQLVPRLIAQAVTSLPLADAAKGLAISGAVVAALCALFVFHASSGYIRSVPLRVLLAVTMVLLSGAPMEIADSGVDTLWYLLPAMFWAVLWCPRTPAGIAVSAAVAFFAAATTCLVFLFAPLLAIRVYALRRARDHAVTAGWLAGCFVQLPFVVDSAVTHQSRLVGAGGAAFGRDNRWGNSLTFYLHDVVLRAPGWRLSWAIQSLTTVDRATLIVGVALAAVLTAIAVTRPGSRPFLVVALVTGFVFVVFPVYLDPWDACYPVTFGNEDAARYTALPILLIEAALIIGADCGLRGRPDFRAQHAAVRRHSVTALRPALAAVVLTAFLIANWAADFRYFGIRTGPTSHRWAPVVAEWRHDCAVSRTGTISPVLQGTRYNIPCDHIRFLPRRARS